MVETTATLVKCARCGRQLTAAKSTARALGPVCARKASAEAPAAEPQAAPAVVAIAAGKVRRSAAIPGLTYETSVRDGVVYLEFRQGVAFEVIAIAGGQVAVVDCSDRVGLTRAALDHSRAFAHALAVKLAGKEVA